MSRDPSTEKQYQVKTSFGQPPNSQHGKADNFGNADLIINDDEVGNFKTASKPTKQRAMVSPRPFVKINSPQQQPTTTALTHNRSQGSIDTLPLSKGTAGFTNNPNSVVKQMHQTTREGQSCSPFGFLQEQQQQDHQMNADSRESSQNKKQHLLASIESEKFKERSMKRKKLTHDIADSQRSPSKNSFRKNQVARRNTESKDNNSGESPTRTHRKTVTLTLASGRTDDHHSVRTESQDDELITASIDKNMPININKIANRAIGDSFDKNQYPNVMNIRGQKPSIVSLLNLADSTESLGESSLRDTGHPLYLGMQNQGPKFSQTVSSGRLKSLGNETQKALFDQLTLKTEESEEVEVDPKTAKLKVILLKAMKMNKTSTDKTWNQMTPFERSKIKEDFEELLRNVSKAEKLGLTVEVTERRRPIDLIQGLNSCLSAEQAQKSKRSYQNSPIIEHTSGFQFRDAINKKMVSKKHRGDNNIVVIRNEIGAADPAKKVVKKRTTSISHITGSHSIMGGWDKQSQKPGRGEVTPHFKNEKKLKVISLAKNKQKSVLSTVPTSPQIQHIRKKLTKSQATETELDGIQQPSRNTIRASMVQDGLPQTSHQASFKNEVWTQQHGKIASGQQSHEDSNISVQRITFSDEIPKEKEQPHLWVETTQQQAKYIEFQDQIFAQTYTGLQVDQPVRLNDDSDLQQAQLQDARKSPSFITTGKLPSVDQPLSPREAGKDTQSSQLQMAQLAALQQSQISRDVFAKLVELTKKQNNSSREDPDKIVESTLTAISLTKQYGIGSAAVSPRAPLSPPKTDVKVQYAVQQSSDLSHLYTAEKAAPAQNDLGSSLKITPLDSKRFVSSVERVKLLNTTETDSVREESQSDVQTKRVLAISNRNMDQRPSNQVSEVNNSDIGNLKSSDAIPEQDQELKSRNATQSMTQPNSLQAQQELLMTRSTDIHVVQTKQNVARVSLQSGTQTPVGNSKTLVQNDSGAADLDISPLQLVAKLSIGNSDPALKKKAENAEKRERAKTLAGRGSNKNNPTQKSTLQNNRLHPHKGELNSSARRNTLVTGWEMNPSPSGLVNRDSSVDILLPASVPLQNLNQQPDHTSSARAKLQLLERRMAEHNAPVLTPSKFKANNQKNSLAKVNMSQLASQTVRQGRSDLKGLQTNTISSGARELDGNQLRGGIKGVKKDLRKAQEKHHSPNRVVENSSRLTAKFVETEINDSIEAFYPPTYQGEQMLRTGMLTTNSSQKAPLEYVEVEGKTIDPMIMFMKDGLDNSVVKMHNNSVGQLNPTFPKKQSKARLDISPGGLEANLKIKQNPTYGFKSNATFNKATTESMHSSARSPFKVQAACQANAKTPSERSESDYQISSQKQQETAQPRGRLQIVGNITNIAKLNLTTTERFTSSNYMINVQNPGVAVCLNSETPELCVRGDEQINNEGLAEVPNTQRHNAIDILTVGHKIKLNEESQMSNRRPTELKQTSHKKQIEKHVIGNRSQSLAPPENHSIKVKSLRKTIVATFKNQKTDKISGNEDKNAFSTKMSTQKDNPQIFNGEELPRHKMQTVKKLDLRTPLHKLLTSEQMEELQTLLGSKTYRRKQARQKAYLMGPQEVDEDDEPEVGRNRGGRAMVGYQSARDANSHRVSPMLKLSDQSVVKTVLPSLKHPAFNIANTTDLEYNSAVYSKQRTTEHVNRVNKLSAANQTSLILLDPLAGQIKIKHKTSHTFNSLSMAPRSKIATKDKEIIFKNTITVKKLQIKSPQHHTFGAGVGQQYKTARNSPFLASGPFSVASPQSQAMTQTQTQTMTTTSKTPSTMTMAASARMPNVSKRYHSKQKSGETFIFNDINNLDEDMKKNSALVVKLFKSNAQ